MNDGSSFGRGGGLFLSSPVFELSSHLIGTVEIKASSEVVLRLSKTSSSSSPSELLLQIPEGCLSENATFRLKGDRRCNSVYRYLVFYTTIPLKFQYFDGKFDNPNNNKSDYLLQKQE